jgi:hypothetical protein
MPESLFSRLLLWTLYFNAASASLDTNSTAVEAIAVDHPTYFQYESAQLAESGLSNSLKRLLRSFNFDNYESPPSIARRTLSGSCKVFPGDSSWPADSVWETFDQILGHTALIKTVPLASPCYNGKYYDAAICAQLTANWTSSYLQ